MRKLIQTIIAALFAAFAVSTFAQDPVKTDPDPNKPGRQIDDGTVKTDPAAAADKPGRAADEESVKAGGATDKPGRTVDEQKAKKKKKKEMTQ
jgi:hypothetical protein